jgi:uncharacterized membrane protein YhaH (DUF805 family)
MMDFLFSFKGRVRRRDFWVFFIATWILTSITFWSFTGFHRPNEGFNLLIWHSPSIGHGLLGTVLSLGVLWANLAVLCKRWHDRAKSGWWTLIGLVPVIGGLWILIECGFLEGTDGDNKYGPSPKTVA